MRRGFTLVELISSIAILALLTVTLVVTIPNFVNWARETSDKQTLTVLNDALNRYKTQGGDVNALTTGTPIAHVISKLQTAVTWSGKGHEFLSGGRTFIGRSIAALGEHHQYRFTRYDHYEAEAGGSSPAESTYPYGEGVGYMSNGGSGGGLDFILITSSGYYSYSVDGGQPATNTTNTRTIIPVGESATFWASDDSGGMSGQVTAFNYYGYNLSDLIVSGLTSLQTLICQNNLLTSIDVNGLANLQSLQIGGNQINTLNLHDLPNLQFLSCDASGMTTLNITNCPALTGLVCSQNQLASLVVSGFPNLNQVAYQNNPFTESQVALDAFYGSLPACPGGLLLEFQDDPSLSNGIGDSTIATNKGWVFSDF